ncbi:MAG: phosphotransferase family protein [Myxococcota bacterium]
MSLDDAVPARPGEELDAARVAEFVRARIPGTDAPLEVLQFPRGHANLTYLLRFGARELVLRRPPHGPVARGAHDMAREHRVLSQLWRLYSRAPRALALCEDEGLIGAKFFVMERCRGVIIRRRVPQEIDASPGGRRSAALAVVDAMAELHAVDPAAVGLGDLGQPENFVARQLRGWRERWERAKQREVPLFERVHARLEATRPESSAPALLHNDWKLDNAMFDPANPGAIRAVLDWDMATRGDPLVDLGTLLGYWSEAGDGEGRSSLTPVTREPGFPARAELAARYAERRGISVAAIRWYEAFALWKIAVVLQQIYIRYARGQTSDPRFATLGEIAVRLIEAAAQIAETPIR